MSKASISTETNWSHNRDAGEVLVGEVMGPLGLDSAVLADAIAVPGARVQAMIDGHVRIDSEFDLRVARYLRRSDGLFVGLQYTFEIPPGRRALNELEKTLPRAARAIA